MNGTAVRFHTMRRVICPWPLSLEWAVVYAGLMASATSSIDLSRLWSEPD